MDNGFGINTVTCNLQHTFYYLQQLYIIRLDGTHKQTHKQTDTATQGRVWFHNLDTASFIC